MQQILNKKKKVEKQESDICCK